MIRNESRAAIYARMSTELQNPLSPADQQRKCREFAAKNEIAVLDEHVYVDEALSGVGMDRPALRSLRDAAKKKLFDVILVDDTSRLGRNQGSMLLMIDEFAFEGVKVICVSQGIDSSHKQSRMVLGFHAVMDDLYVRELADKTHRGLEGCVIRGVSTGGRCFGYDRVPAGTGTSKRHVVNEGEAAIVRRIFEMSAADCSLKSIARKLNEEHAAGRADWCPTGIRSKLLNEIYKGEVVWNRRGYQKVPGTNRRVARPHDPSEWKRVSRPDLAIVSVDLWTRVQHRLNRFGDKASEGRRRGLLSREVTSRYLFSGLLKCGDCGENLIVATGGGTHVHKKYACRNYFNRGTCENDLYIRVDDLERRILGRLQSELLRPEVIDYAIGEFGRQLHAALSTVSTELASLRRRKQQLDKEIGHFTNAIGRGGPLDSLVREVAKRESESKAITNRLLSSTAGSVETHLQEVRRFVTSGISDLRSLLGRDAALAKAELHRHLSKIRMTPAEDGKNWHYLAEGSWNLLGTGPSAPAFGLAHSDGCGGWI